MPARANTGTLLNASANTDSSKSKSEGVVCHLRIERRIKYEARNLYLVYLGTLSACMIVAFEFMKSLGGLIKHVQRHVETFFSEIVVEQIFYSRIAN